jgi:hypothetical protein
VSSHIVLSDEEARVLRAAAQGRLWRNGAGRWIINEDARPQRASRERLKDLKLIDWQFGRGDQPLRLICTAAGHELLASQPG